MKILVIFVVVSFSTFAKISYQDAFIRLMPPGSFATAGFITIKNGSNTAVDLIGVESNFSKVTELHTHVVKDGIMQMRQVKKMKVPAKGELVLKPHGKHLMFLELTKKLDKNLKPKANLKFSNGKELKVLFKKKK
tara:strand:- start:134 stop:538 length:405 start_codon:yes stop_codon:yes gene_type:complete